MDGCVLCTKDQDDLAEGATIVPVYSMSAYEGLAGSELARKLLAASEPIFEARRRTAEEERHMLPEEKAAARFKKTEPPFLDFTVWPHLSVSLLQAGLLSAARESRRDGDPALAREHERNAEKVDAAVAAGNATAMGYLQDEAGYARIDPPGMMDSRYAAKRGASRWLDARDWVAGTFPQFASFSGGPRLHVHNLIVNRVQAERTGEWGILDTTIMADAGAAAGAIGRRVIMEALGRDPGVAWERTADGKGFEIAGIDPRLMEFFASYPSRKGKPSQPAQHTAPATAPSSQTKPVSLKDEFKNMGWLD